MKLHAGGVRCLIQPRSLEDILWVSGKAPRARQRTIMDAAEPCVRGDLLWAFCGHYAVSAAGETVGSGSRLSLKPLLMQRGGMEWDSGRR